MITDLETGNMMLSKPYKQFLGVCRSKIKEMKHPNTEIKARGNTIDIVDYISFICSKTFNQDNEEAFGSMLSISALRKIAKALKDSNRRSKLPSSNKNLDSPDETNVDDRIDLLTRLYLGPNRYSYDFFALFKALISNEEELGVEIIAEALTIAFMVVNGSIDEELHCSILHQACAIVYWWAYNNGYYEVYFRHIKVSSKKYEFKIKKPKADVVSLEDFVDSLYVTPEAKKLSLQFIENDDAVIYFLYTHSDDYVEAVLKQCKNPNNNVISSVLNDLINSRLNDKFFSDRAITEFIDRRKLHKYAAFLIACSNYIPWEYSDIEPDNLLLYMEYITWEHPTGRGVSLDKRKRLKLVLQCFSQLARYQTYAQFVGTFYNSLPVFIKRLEQEITDKQQAEGKAEQLKIRSDNFKGQYKQFEQANKKLRSEIQQLKSEIHTLEGKTVSDMSKDDVEKLRKEHKASQDELEDLNRQLNEAQRTIIKLQTKIDKLTGSMDELETEALKAMEERDRLQSLNSELAVHRVFNSIPIKCFVNAIKGYSIHLIGGDMMHSKLLEYGLTNITYSKSGCKDLGRSDVINKDLVVVATAYVDHSTVEFLPKQIRLNPNIRVLKYNNKNADGLVYEMFKCLYQQ